MDALAAFESFRAELAIKVAGLEDVSDDTRKLGKEIVTALDKVISEMKAGE